MEKKQVIPASKDNEIAEELSQVSMEATVGSQSLTASSSAGIRSSGVALRKKYVYAERDRYIDDTKTVPGPELMAVFRREAELTYPHDGDYIVKDEVATYLGIG